MTDPTRSAFTDSLREATVVVFSILLAFALDSWWDGFQEERQASALAAAVVEELVANETSLATSVERHRAISAAIADAQLTGSTQAVHPTAVIAREIWEPRTAALETLLSFQRSTSLADAGLRVQLGAILELLEEYRERELRAAAFQDRARERIAESGLPIYTRGDAVRPVYSDQVVLNFLALRNAEESAAVETAESLSASIRSAIESLAGRSSER